MSELTAIFLIFTLITIIVAIATKGARDALGLRAIAQVCALELILHACVSCAIQFIRTI
jgi:hypothetical protein